MSDNQTDPVIEHLRERRNLLKEEIRDSRSRLDEIEGLIVTLEDGRSRVNRKRKGIIGTPPATQPEPDDDSVSLDEVHG